MENKPTISVELFESLMQEAVDDLRQSGLDHEKIFQIIEKEFSLKYAHKFCAQ